MQIGRGVTFGSENGVDVFGEDVHKIDFGKAMKWIPPKKLKRGIIVAEGQFGFKRGQNIAIAILLVRMFGIPGKPVLSFSEDKTKIIFDGLVKTSKVYKEMARLVSSEEDLKFGIKKFF